MSTTDHHVQRPVGLDESHDINAFGELGQQPIALVEEVIWGLAGERTFVPDDLLVNARDALGKRVDFYHGVLELLVKAGTDVFQTPG